MVKEHDALVDFEDKEQMMYVERDDGTYGAVRTGSYLTKHYLDDFWDKRRHLEQEAERRLCAGEISPVAYHMLLVDIPPADVAARVGVSTGKVKKHMTSEGFGRVTVDLLARYAEVFGVPVANLFQVVPYREGEVALAQDPTDNPHVVRTALPASSPPPAEPTEEA